jgi:hypothetical protein
MAFFASAGTGTAAESKLPEFYGTYILVKGNWAQIKDELLDVDPEVQILLFDKNIASVSVQDVQLRRLVLIRSKVFGNPLVFKRGFIQDVKEINVLRWDGRGDSLVSIGVKPVQNQPEMIQVVPAKLLSPGYYEVTHKNSSVSWRFTVQKHKAQTSCFDEYHSNVYMGHLQTMAGELGELKPCEVLDQAQGRSSSQADNVPSVSTGQPVGETRIARMTQNFPLTKHFVEQEKAFPIQFDLIWAAAKQTLLRTGSKKTEPDKITYENLEKGMLMAGETVNCALSLGPFVLGSCFSRQFVIVLDRITDHSTKLGVKGFCYDLKPNQKLPWVPDRCSKWFLEDLEKELEAYKNVKGKSAEIRGGEGPATRLPLPIERPQEVLEHINYQEEEKRYRDALERDSDKFEAHANLGRIYLRLQDFEKSIYHHRQAMNLRPDDPNAYYNTACTYAKTGETEKAIALLKQSVAKGFKDFDRMRKDSDLESIRNEPGFKSLVER